MLTGLVLYGKVRMCRQVFFACRPAPPFPVGVGVVKRVNPVV